MADHSLPTSSSTYANFVSQMSARFNDLAAMMDPAVTTPTNVPTNSIRWNTSNNRFERYNGTSWGQLSNTYAFQDIVLSSTITLSAGTANGVPYLNASKVLTSGAALFFDGTNFGIGTNSPNAKLTVSDAGGIRLEVAPNYSGGVVRLLAYNRITPGYIPMFYDGADHRFNVNSIEVARLDASGNFGLGVVPSAWGGSLGFEIGSYTGFRGGSGVSNIAHNCYINGTWKYRNTAAASLVEITGATTMWYTAPSGTAGAAITFTQAMALDASGNLSLTSPAANIYVQPSTATNNAFTRYINAGGIGFVGLDTSAGNLGGASAAYALHMYHTGAYPIIFTTNSVERARIDSAGNLGLGVTPKSWVAYKAIQIGQAGAFISDSGSLATGVTSNVYYDGTYRYINTNSASIYLMTGSNHSWSVAPSGAAGSAITWTQVMMLNASGQLQVTSSSGATGIFNSTAAGGAYIAVQASGTNVAYMGNAAALISGGSASDMAFTTPAANNMLFAIANVEKVRISSNGGLSVGTTTDAGAGNILANGTVSDGTGVIRPMVQGTTQATTSGTSKDFTGIPSWAKQITVMFHGVSTNGTSVPLIQLGSGSPATTGYNTTTISVSPGGGANTYTNGFGLTSAANVAASLYYGSFIFTHMGGNVWVCQGALSIPNLAGLAVSGSIALSGVLDRIRLTTANGTDAFDAGSINIIYE